jgi:drug/metabolite transporter (DMT)-like permease
MKDRIAKTAVLTAMAMCAFAANSIFCRMALAHTGIDPATFTLMRLCSGALVLSLITFAGGHRRIAGSLPMAIALVVYAACFSFAYVSLTAATGALLLFGAVQATMIIRGWVEGERLRPLQWGGLGLAIIGLVALLMPGTAAPDPAGAIFMLVAGIAWGAYSLLGRGSTNPLKTTAGNFVRAAPLALPLLLLTVNSWDAQGLLWATLSGALASGMGYAIWYAALPGLNAARAASIQLSVPVITTVSGILLLGEQFSVHLALASVTILGGIALVVWGHAKSESQGT